jgi:hypothetical protein
MKDFVVHPHLRHRIASRRFLRAKAFFVWLAPVVALVVGIAPALASLHRALVPHRVCEHGDLIELAQGPANPDGFSVDEGSRSPSISANSADEQHRHDHCLLAALGRTLFAPPASQAGFVVTSVAQIARTEFAEPRFFQSILSFAPKTSPPAVPSNV